MKRILALILAALLLCGVVSAQAEEYCTIAELRQQTPQRLTCFCETEAGPVDVDAPIILPQQDKLPALTVRLIELSEFPDFYEDIALEKDGYGGAHVSVTRNLDRKYPEVNPLKGLEMYYKPWQEEYAEDNPYSPEEAQALVQDIVEKVLGWKAGIDYKVSAFGATSKLYLYDEKSKTILHPLTDTGAYEIELQQLFHGSTVYWKGLHFITETAQTSREPVPPGFYVAATVYNNHSFSLTSVHSLKQVDFLAEDVPLLPFSKIQEIIQALVQSGRMIRVDEIQLCDLVLFITPDGSRDVYQAMPCWKVVGLIPEIGSTSLPKYPGWLMINAQTGAVIDPESIDPHRGRANELITWDQLQ